MLACDYIEEKLKFPLILQPKIDGVRGMNLDGQFTGRSMKPPANKFCASFFSQRQFIGLDGEIAAQSETHPNLCSLTSSALSTIAGEPFLLWHCFDYITKDTISLPYIERLQRLENYIQIISTEYKQLVNRLRVIQCKHVTTLDDLLYQDAMWLAAGYEGTIVRDPNGKYKQGRSTPNQGGLLRIKRFANGEMLVTGIEEGKSNCNEATVGANGYTERSTHQENMVPNGMVGTLLGKDTKTGANMKCAAGRMTHQERIDYFNFPQKLIGKQVKFKHFLKGVKDKPRFPTFQCIKIDFDIGVDV